VGLVCQLVCLLLLAAQQAAASQPSEEALPGRSEPLAEAAKTMTEADVLHLRSAVVEMFDHAWKGYMTHAFPDDELKPLSCTGRHRGRDPSRGTMDYVLGHYSLTLIDSLDTLAVIGKHKEFVDAVNYISRHVNFEADVVVSLFEVTIRVLGGLISGHLLASEPSLQLMPSYNGALLRLAEDLGDRLLPALKTKSHIPWPLINLQEGDTAGSQTDISLAEAGTLQLEFFALSALTGSPRFRRAALQVSRALWARRTPLNLMGKHLDVMTGQWRLGVSGVGAGADSYYEYLLKLYVMTGDTEFLQMWQTSYQAMKKHLLHEDWYLDANMASGETVSHNVDSLMAFLPGTLVLAGEVEAAARNHLNFYRLWRRFGLMPENFNVRAQAFPQDLSRGYPLRPEFIESTYFLYRATRNPFYLEVGKYVLESLNKHTRVPCGFAAVEDVLLLANGTAKHEDRMDSFFLAETLKYLYLLFDNASFVHEAPYVFNTEGHLLPLIHSSLARASIAGSSPAPTGLGRRECALVSPAVSALLAAPPLTLQPLAPAPPAAPAARIEFKLTSRQNAVAAVADPMLPLEFRIEAYVATTRVFAGTAAGAAFGPGLRDSCLEREFAFARPAVACSWLANTAELEGKIVVVARGSCLFAEKVFWAQEAGAVAVIVVDETSSTGSLAIMSADEQYASRIRIPSFYLPPSNTKLGLLPAGSDPHLLRIEVAALPEHLPLEALGAAAAQHADRALVYVSSELDMESREAFVAIFQNLFGPGNIALPPLEAWQTITVTGAPPRKP
jgi:hypothetical protein